MFGGTGPFEPFVKVDLRCWMKMHQVVDTSTHNFLLCDAGLADPFVYLLCVLCICCCAFAVKCVTVCLGQETIAN